MLRRAAGSDLAHLAPLDYSRQIPLFERLELETLSNCNRDCWFCPRSYDRSGTYLDASGRRVIDTMPTATVIDILDQAAALGFDGEVTFHFYSEPLLDTRNPYFAREARRRGMRPFLHTNGDVLRANESLHEEVSAVYDYIVVGLYDYESQEELEAEMRYWEGALRGPGLRFSYIGKCGGRAVPSLGVPRALVPSDARMTLPDLVFDHAPCSRPLQRMLIRYDGKMANCCEDMAAELELGSIYDHTLEQLWFSTRHAAVVTAMRYAAGVRYRRPVRRPMERAFDFARAARPTSRRLYGFAAAGQSSLAGTRS